MQLGRHVVADLLCGSIGAALDFALVDVGNFVRCVAVSDAVDWH